MKRFALFLAAVATLAVLAAASMGGGDPIAFAFQLGAIAFFATPLWRVAAADSWQR